MSISNDDNATLNSEPICTVDPYDYLKIVRKTDGTITRLLNIPSSPAAPDSANTPSKDVPLNPSWNTWIRIYLPSPNPPPQKLPLVIYFHGSGFIFSSPASTMHHDLCSGMAAEIGAVVLSVGYRLAPEHRLPAAYDDAEDALRFAASGSDTWLRDFADTSKCFLAGTSSGGNIAYRTAIRAAAAESGVKIRGLVLHHPFFGGVTRTASEFQLVNDRALLLSSCELMWELALPIGADRDHKYANPTAAEEECGLIGRLGARVLVIGCGGDLLIDRQVAVVEMLKRNGVEAVGEFSEGDYHGIELMDVRKAKAMFVLLKGFVNVK